MKQTLIKNLAKLCAVLLIVTTLASCAKKSIGCPTDLKAPSLSILK